MKKILHVEDDRKVHFYLCSVLRPLLDESLFKDIDWAKDGDIALNLFQGQPEAYGLIITDYHMPKMDGIEFLRQTQNCNVPRLMLSHDTEKSALSVHYGAVGVLPKATHPEIIVGIVRNLYLQYPLTDELNRHILTGIHFNKIL